MSRWRRQAQDFSDSLERFRASQGDSTTEWSRETHRSFSQDSLNEISLIRPDETARFEKHNPVPGNKTRSAKHSEILAGSSAKSSLLQDSFSSCTTKHSAHHDILDLNKRINLFQNENLKERRKSDNELGKENKQNANSQCPKTSTLQSKCVRCKSGGVLDVASRGTFGRNNVLCEKSNRDNNCNIKNNRWFVLKEKIDSKIEQVKENTNAKQSSLLAKEDEDVHSTEFESILCALDNKLNQIKETSQPERVLKRLSNQYNFSPRKFTERLLTIIEDSVVSSDDNICSTPGVDFKFIENESMPDWPSAIISPQAQTQKMSTPINPSPGTNTSYHQSKSSTPKSSMDKIKTPKSFFKRIAKHVFVASPDSKNNSSTTENSTITFEHLEAQCNKLYTNDREKLRRSISLPSLSCSMNDIQIICEKQMAALNEPDGRNEKLIKQEKYSSMEQLSPAQQVKENNSKDLQYKNISYAKRKYRTTGIKAGAARVGINKPRSTHLSINPDEFEKTLLQDITAKRKRCLDTAKIIMEINANAVSKGTKKPISSESPSNNEANSSNNEAKFLNTLMSCKMYHTYLTKQKPLLDLLHNTNSTTPESTLDRTALKRTEIPKIQVSHLQVHKSPRTKSGSQNCLSRNLNSPMRESPMPGKSPLVKSNKSSANSNSRTRKPRLFVTPGNSPVNNGYKKKKVYFPSMEITPKNSSVGNVIKSPRSNLSRRLNYNNVISPVGLYIRGIKNRSDGLLLTPTEKKVKPSPARSENLKQVIPSLRLSFVENRRNNDQFSLANVNSKAENTGRRRGS